jgi:hypothetical protein
MNQELKNETVLTVFFRKSNKTKNILQNEKRNGIQRTYNTTGEYYLIRRGQSFGKF